MRATCRSASPLASNCSRANSRIVSSIPNAAAPPPVRVRLPQQALVDQRGDAVEDVDAQVAAPHRRDGLGGLQRAAADEDGQPPEQGLLVRRAAGRGSRRWRRASSAAAPAGRARPPVSSGSRSLQPGQQRRRRQHLDPRRRQLDRQRQPVQPGADRRHRRRRSRSVEREVGLRPPAPAATKSATAADGASVRGAGSPGPGRAAPAAAPGTRCSPRRRAAAPGWWPAPCSRGAGGEQVGHERRRRRRPARSCPAPAAAARSRRNAARRSAQRAVARLAHAERLGDGRRRRGRDRATGARATKRDAVGEGVGDSRRRPARASRVLPTPPGPVRVSSRTSGAAQQVDHRRDLALPPDQRRERASAGWGGGRADCALATAETTPGAATARDAFERRPDRCAPTLHRPGRRHKGEPPRRGEIGVSGAERVNGALDRETGPRRRDSLPQRQAARTASERSRRATAPASSRRTPLVRNAIARPRSAVAPADRGAEPAVPERARGAGRARPSTAAVGQSAELEAQARGGPARRTCGPSRRRPRPRASARPSPAGGCAPRRSRRPPPARRRSGPCRGRSRRRWPPGTTIRCSASR